MKIILSRKGFDSSAGGKPSIVVGNKIISFPIPQANTGVFYKDLLSDLDCNYDDIFRDLQITQYSEAHVDPDLYPNIFNNLHKKERYADWKGIFGQDGSAQAHLDLQDVRVGDIFLFFGWYKLAEKNQNTGKFKYKDNVQFKEGFHMLYGFLEIVRRQTKVNFSLVSVYRNSNLSFLC